MRILQKTIRYAWLMLYVVFIFNPFSIRFFIKFEGSSSNLISFSCLNCLECFNAYK